VLVLGMALVVAVAWDGGLGVGARLGRGQQAGPFRHCGVRDASTDTRDRATGNQAKWTRGNDIKWVVAVG